MACCGERQEPQRFAHRRSYELRARCIHDPCPSGRDRIRSASRQPAREHGDVFIVDHIRIDRDALALRTKRLHWRDADDVFAVCGFLQWTQNGWTSSVSDPATEGGWDGTLYRCFGAASNLRHRECYTTGRDNPSQRQHARALDHDQAILQDCSVGTGKGRRLCLLQKLPRRVAFPLLRAALANANRGRPDRREYGRGAQSRPRFHPHRSTGHWHA